MDTIDWPKTGSAQARLLVDEDDLLKQITAEFEIFGRPESYRRILLPGAIDNDRLADLDSYAATFASMPKEDQVVVVKIRVEKNELIAFDISFDFEKNSYDCDKTVKTEKGGPTVILYRAKLS